MALVHTTVSAAVTAADTSITVASATGFSAGYIVRIGDEMMRVGGAYTSGTVIPVIRGQEGTLVVAHAVTSGAVCGAAADWGRRLVRRIQPGPGQYGLIWPIMAKKHWGAYA